MENYIVINGKKAELTDEQLKALGIEVKKKDLFKRIYGEKYYSVFYDGRVCGHYEGGGFGDEQRFNNGDYCVDKSIMKQRALHETLNRLLWRASVQAGEENNAWDEYHSHWYIIYDDKTHKVDTSCTRIRHAMDIYFPTNELAKNAIKNIVEPFIAQHPDFVW